MLLHEQAGHVKTREEFVAFVLALRKDLIQNSDKDEWENPTLERFLEALAAWTTDSDGYYRNNKIPVPENVSWNVFANILMAAKIYE